MLRKSRYFLCLIAIFIFNTAKAQLLDDRDLSFEQVEAIALKSTSVEQFIGHLPITYKNNFTLIHSSGSLQTSTALLPRVISYGASAKSIVTFNGDPNSLRFRTIEGLIFKPETRNFELYEIEFGGSGAKITKNPQVCLSCHGENPKPIWRGYNRWIGAYGNFGIPYGRHDGIFNIESLTDLQLNQLNDREQDLKKYLNNTPDEFWPPDYIPTINLTLDSINYLNFKKTITSHPRYSLLNFDFNKSPVYPYFPINYSLEKEMGIDDPDGRPKNTDGSTNNEFYRFSPNNTITKYFNYYVGIQAADLLDKSLNSDEKSVFISKKIGFIENQKPVSVFEKFTKNNSVCNELLNQISNSIKLKEEKVNKETNLSSFFNEEFIGIRGGRFYYLPEKMLLQSVLNEYNASSSFSNQTTCSKIQNLSYYEDADFYRLTDFNGATNLPTIPQGKYCFSIGYNGPTEAEPNTNDFILEKLKNICSK